MVYVLGVKFRERVVMEHQKAYDLYVQYCTGIGVTPATLEKWTQVERTLVEYTKCSTGVDRIERDRSLGFGKWYGDDDPADY